MLLLREMSEGDSDQIEQLEQKIFNDAWTKAGIDETFRQSHAFIVVAEENKKIQGYCIVYYVMDEAEIARIAVSLENRKKGLGSSLLKKTEEICKKKKVERILLDVRMSNETAICFYRNHGFQEDGVRKRFYEKPEEDALLMSKNLD